MTFNFLPLNTLHRHVLAEMTHNFMLSSTFMLVIMLIAQGVQLRRLVTSLSLGASEFIVLLVYMSPTILLMVVPLCCLLSVFLTLMRLGADRELMALKAGGVSIMQILPAPLWFAAFCGLLTLAFSLYGIAWGADGFRSTLVHLAATKAKLTMQPGIFNQEIGGITLFAQEMDHSTGEIRQVLLEDGGVEGDNTLFILAPRGIIAADSASGSLVFQLWDGHSYVMGEKGVSSVAHFKYFEHHLDLSRIFFETVDSEIKPKEMSWAELRKHNRAPGERESAKFINRVRIEMQHRWALPAACLVFGIFAVSLACSFESAKKHLAVLLALLTLFVYYTLYSAGMTLGEAGRLDPIPAMWGPNALFLLLGLVGLVMASREGAPNFYQFFQRFFQAFRRPRKRERAG